MIRWLKNLFKKKNWSHPDVAVQGKWLLVWVEGRGPVRATRISKKQWHIYVPDDSTMFLVEHSKVKGWCLLPPFDTWMQEKA